MTALTKYQRLEATALWRAGAEGQRREVIVSLGDATLVISDLNDRALTHWSLAAVQRANPGRMPAIYHPDGDPEETLEIGADGAEMVEGIEKLRNAIERRRPHPGRLRLLAFGVSFAAVAALAVFWVPGALKDYAQKVVPGVKRVEISNALLPELQRLTGAPCRDEYALTALTRLSERLRPARGPAPRLVVLRDGLNGALRLPGRMTLIGRGLIEDHDEPDVVAGFILAEQARALRDDPLRHLLDHVPLRATFQLVTTGSLPEDALKSYAEALLASPVTPASDQAILARFAEAGVRSAPYAYARDLTGETTLPLIEGDPYAATPPGQPVLPDADWLRLQGICGN